MNMKMPNPELATVPDAKLHAYLLSFSHPVGRFKAAFFVGIGYSPERAEELRSSLLRIAQGDIATSESTQYGTKYKIRGRIISPTGRSADIVTIWLLPAAESSAQLVTAYPEG